MKVIVFGATGMIGHGVLLECLRDSGVDLVVTIGRTATGIEGPRIREIIHSNFSSFATIQSGLTGFDACFFCLGISSAGMTEESYTRVTYSSTIAAADVLSRINPGMTFVFVSGAGTDSTEKSRSMWARVKGRTENALLQLPLNAFMFRPGFIQPLDGVQSKTPSYRIMYKVLGPLISLLRPLLPNQILTTRQIGLAMLAVARRGYPNPILESRDIRFAVEQLTISSDP